MNEICAGASGNELHIADGTLHASPIVFLSAQFGRPTAHLSYMSCMNCSLLSGFCQAGKARSAARWSQAEKGVVYYNGKSNICHVDGFWSPAAHDHVTWPGSQNGCSRRVLPTVKSPVQLAVCGGCPYAVIGLAGSGTQEGRQVGSSFTQNGFFLGPIPFRLPPLARTAS